LYEPIDRGKISRLAQKKGVCEIVDEKGIVDSFLVEDECTAMDGRGF